MKKKRVILKTASRPFTGQGVEATRTLQISRRAKAVEPLLLNHLKLRDPAYLAEFRTAGIDLSPQGSDVLKREPVKGCT